MGTQNSINVGEELSGNVVVYKNLSPEVVIIDLAKMKNLVREHDDAIRKSTDWISVLALSLSLILANITAEFKSIWGLSAETWKAIFILCNIAALVWLVIVIVRNLTNKKYRSFDFLMEQLTKKSAETEKESMTIV